MKRSTKIVIAIVVLLSIAYAVLAIFSSRDGLPEEADVEVELVE